MSSGALNALDTEVIREWAKEACKRHRDAVPQLLMQNPYGGRVFKAFKTHVMEHVIDDAPNVTYPMVLWRVALVMIMWRSSSLASTRELVDAFERSILCRAMEEVMTKVIDVQGLATDDVSARPLPVSARARSRLTSPASLWQYAILLGIGEHKEACESVGRRLILSLDCKDHEILERAFPSFADEYRDESGSAQLIAQEMGGPRFGHLHAYFMGDQRDETTLRLDKRDQGCKRRRVELPIQDLPTYAEKEAGAHYLSGDDLEEEHVVPLTQADLGLHKGPPVECGFLFKVQNDALHKILGRDSNNFLLIGTPGSGKTAIILALKAMQKPRCMLVVAPSHLIPNWLNEHEKYASRLRLNAPYIDVENDIKEWLQTSGMFIVSPNNYRKHFGKLALTCELTIVVDEAHVGMGAQESQFLKFHKSIMAGHRGSVIAITGTPIRRGLKTNLMQFLELYFPLDVAALSVGWFDAVWKMMTSEDDSQRAVGTKVLQDKFCKKMFIMPTVDGSKEYAIRRYRIHADVKVPMAVDTASFFRRYEDALKATQRQRVTVVKQLVEMYRQGQERGIILFVTRKEMVEALKCAIPDALVYTGHTRDKGKAEFLKYFEEREPLGKVGIMMASMAVGVTLSVGANIAVMVQPLFSASDQVQAWGRIDRIGQKEKLVEFTEVCMTAEEYGISRLCDSKQDQADALNGKKSSDDAANLLVQKIRSLQKQPEDGKFIGNAVLDEGTEDELTLSFHEKPLARNKPKNLNPREIALCAANEERRLTRFAVQHGQLSYLNIKFDSEHKELYFELEGNFEFFRVAYRYVKGKDLVYDDQGALSGKCGKLDAYASRIGNHRWTVIDAIKKSNGEQLGTFCRPVKIRWGGRKYVVVARVERTDGTWSGECYPIMHWWASPLSFS